MKKGYFLTVMLLFLCALCIVFFPTVANAEDVIIGTCGDDLTWSLENGVFSISGTGDMFNYEYANNRPWHIYADQIVTLVIGDGVKSIGSHAFNGCKNLQMIDFGNTVESIGMYAFYCCESLAELTLPESLIVLGQNCFEYCTKISSLEIPENVRDLGACSFRYCTNLSYVNIKGNPNLPYFTITCGYFVGCTSLEEIHVEDDHIVFSSVDGVLYAGDILIQYPSGKKDTKWTVRDGTTSIYDDGFSHAMYLEELYLPEGFLRISSYAFYNCSRLTTISLPDSLDVIGRGNFGHCDQLQNIILSENANFSYHDGILYNRSLTEIIWASRFVPSAVIIPDGVTCIPSGTFAKLEYLNCITLPQSVTRIEGYAFSGCSNLTTIEIPESVTYIGMYAFQNCKALTNITLPNGIESIQTGTFSTCESLQSIVIPDGVTTIYEGAFSSCFNLKSVVIPDSVENIRQAAFFNCFRLWHVLYKGTEENWDTISFGVDNSALTNATRHDNCTGEEVTDPVNKVCTICDPPVEAPAVLGDVNGDGVINTRDAKLIMQYELGLVDANALYVKNADVNGDCAVNTRDAKLIMQHELGIITQFQPAFHKDKRLLIKMTEMG